MSGKMRALILICILGATAAGQQPTPLADFSPRTLDARRMSSDDLKDKIVVLDFWATWCENCVSEIPEFNKLEKEYSSELRSLGSRSSLDGQVTFRNLLSSTTCATQSWLGMMIRFLISESLVFPMPT